MISKFCVVLTTIAPISLYIEILLLSHIQKIEEKITIRHVTSTDRKLEIRERMKKRYAHKNYPDEFPFRFKCILVFQNLDGVDVVLFAL